MVGSVAGAHGSQQRSEIVSDSEAGGVVDINVLCMLFQHVHITLQSNSTTCSAAGLLLGLTIYLLWWVSLGAIFQWLLCLDMLFALQWVYGLSVGDSLGPWIQWFCGSRVRWFQWVQWIQWFSGCLLDVGRIA